MKDALLHKFILLLSDLVVYESIELHVFLKKLIKVLLEVIPVDSCLIYTFDRKKQELTLIASKRPHPKLLGKVKLQSGEGITGWVAKNMQTATVYEKAYKDPRFKNVKDLPEDTYEAFLSLPIMDKNGVVGVVNMQNKKPYFFKKHEVKTVEAVVRILASAFVQIALHKQITRLETELEDRKIIEKAKGILMKEFHLSEHEAYEKIRAEAMRKRKTKREIAEAALLIFAV